MRLLFLTPGLPSPPSSGGTRRMEGLISGLARAHEVAVLAFVAPGEDVERGRVATEAYASVVVTVEHGWLRLTDPRKRLRQAFSLLRRDSFERWMYVNERYQRTLDELARRWEPDAIVVEFAQMGYCRLPEGIPVVLDAHNVEHEILARAARIDGSLARLLYSRVNAAKLRRDERGLARRVDGVAVTSERDRELFRSLALNVRGGAPMPHGPAAGIEPVVVPNGVDCEAFRPSGMGPATNELLFFGALDYFPNADAILSFHREVWPRLRKGFPDLKLNIVGRQPQETVRALAREPGITVTGVVEDVRPWIERAAVVVVPLRAGSGTRLKVLEALAMTRPVVSTSLGVEGLDVESGKHLLIADVPADFASHVARILDDPDFGRSIGQAGRRLVEARYDWRAIAVDFGAIVERVVERRHASKRAEITSG